MELVLFCILYYNIIPGSVDATVLQRHNDWWDCVLIVIPLMYMHVERELFITLLTSVLLCSARLCSAPPPQLKCYTTDRCAQGANTYLIDVCTSPTVLPLCFAIYLSFHASCIMHHVMLSIPSMLPDRGKWRGLFLASDVVLESVTYGGTINAGMYV